MIHEAYEAGCEDALEKLAGFRFPAATSGAASKLKDVRPGIGLPASTLIKQPNPTLTAAKQVSKADPSKWQHGSVLNYNKGQISNRPLSAGEAR